MGARSAHEHTNCNPKGRRGGNEARSSVGGCCRPRFKRKQQILLFRRDNRRVLPPFLPFPFRETRKCTLPRYPRGCGAGRISSVQALSAEPASAIRTTRFEDRGSLSSH